MKALAWVALIIAIACFISGAVVDPDLWWHIVVGRWILAHRELPIADHWNMFGVSTPWLAYSWLFEVAMAPIDRYFGARGLLVAQVLLAAGIVGFICYIYRGLAKSWFAGSYIGVLVTVPLYYYYTLRPQSIAWGLQAALIAICFSIVDAGPSRRRLAALALVMVLWANLHITTAVGLGIIAAVLVGAGRWPVAIAALLLGTLATLLTPYLGREWLVFLDAMGVPRELPAIVELQPSAITEIRTLFALLLSALVGIAAARHRRTWPPLLPVAAVVLVAAGLAVTKFLPMALILLGAMVARSLGTPAAPGGDAEGPWERFRDMIRQVERGWTRVPAAVIAAGSLASAAFSFLPLWREPLVATATPVEFADRIIGERLPHPVLNDFSHGGYFMYRYADADGNPAHLVPVDGRHNVLPPDRLSQYRAMEYGAEDWYAFVDAVDPRTVVFHTGSPLVALLKATGDWCVIGRISGGSEGTALLLRRDEFELRERGGQSLAAENCP